MDGSRFDALTKTLGTAHSRRTLTRLLGGLSLGGVLSALGVPAAQATHFGCRHVGKPCTSNDQCCSSRCPGPEGSKTCRAHHTGGCTKADDACRSTSGGPSPCPNIPNGTCFITIGNAPFCGESNGAGCERCRSDQDCVQRLGYPPGSACLFLHSICETTCGANNDGDLNDRACYPPAVCTETVNCSGLDVQCGTWPGACGQINCGTCPTGQHCNNEGFCDPDQ
jgi:hypothetical protein